MSLMHGLVVSASLTASRRTRHQKGQPSRARLGQRECAHVQAKEKEEKEEKVAQDVRISWSISSVSLLSFHE